MQSDRVMRLAAVIWAIALGIAAIMVVNPLLSTSSIADLDAALDAAAWAYTGTLFLALSLPAIAGARLLRVSASAYARWLGVATVGVSATGLVVLAREVHGMFDAVGDTLAPLDALAPSDTMGGSGWTVSWVFVSLAITGGIASVGVRALPWQRWLGTGILMVDALAAGCWLGIITDVVGEGSSLVQTARVAIICSALAVAGVLAVNVLEALDSPHLRAHRKRSVVTSNAFGARPGTTVAAQIAQAAEAAEGPMAMGGSGEPPEGPTAFAPGPAEMLSAELADAIILTVRTWRAGLRARVVADSAHAGAPGQPSQQEAEELRARIAAARADLLALNAEVPDRVAQATVGCIAALGQLVHAPPEDLVEVAPAVDAALRAFIDDPERRDWVATHRTPSTEPAAT